MTLLAYPDSVMEARLLKNEPSDAVSAEYDISSDEESESMSPNRRSEVDDHSR